MAKNTPIGSKKLTSNILGSSIYKAITIVANLLLIRVSVNYMGEEKYGIWLTVLSFFTWFSVLEVGISNSFRNKLTAYFTSNNFLGGKQLIQGIYKKMTFAYVTITIILILASFIFPVDSFFLPDNHASNDFEIAFRLSTLFYMMFYIAFALNTILLATHHAKTTYLITALQSVALVIGIYFFNYFEIEPSLTLVFTWFSAVPLVFWFIANGFIYKKSLNKFAPNLLKGFSQQTSRNGQKMNIAFFVIQLCTLIIYSTDNLIIINALSGTEVLKYNVAFKYFNILVVVFNLILIPYWSSFTEASILKNKSWISSHIKKLILIWFGIMIGAIILLVLSDLAYKIWIGKQLNIPYSLSLFMSVSILLTAWNSIFAYYLNSVSIIKRQMILLIFSAIINIPLSFYLIHIFNATGVIIATCFALLPMAILLPIQYYHVIKKME